MNKYTFKPYRPLFPSLYSEEKKRLSPILEKDYLIEHIGSTAVPGLGGKGIIDIAIAVPKEKMEEVSPKLQNLGYEFRPTFSTPDRFYFITYLPDPEEGERRYHLHLTYPENREWTRFIQFRDYLRSRPEAAAEYATLKQQGGEGAHYRRAKEPFFKRFEKIE